MAVTAFLNLGQSATGESRQKGQEGSIELTAWSWTFDADSSWTKGGGASVGKPNPGALVWAHAFDSASIELFRLAWTGRSIPTAQLRVLRSGEGSTGGPAHLVVTMTDVLITEAITSHASEDRVQQSVSMVFRTIAFEYRPQDEKGVMKAAQIVSWDIPAGKVSPSSTASAPAAPAAPAAPEPPVPPEPPVAPEPPAATSGSGERLRPAPGRLIDPGGPVRPIP